MTVEAINAILLPPFLFALFFSFVSILLYQPKSAAAGKGVRRATSPVSVSETLTVKEPVLISAPTQARETVTQTEKPEQVAAHWVGLRDMLDEEEELCAID